MALKRFHARGICPAALTAFALPFAQPIHKATFRCRPQGFINEAKMLAKFAHPALVECFRFWEGNGTAYMAMRSLQRRNAAPGSGQRATRTSPSVSPGNGADFSMRWRCCIANRCSIAISPDNIMLADGRSVLLDFGSARKIIGDATQALTTVLKPGYAR